MVKPVTMQVGQVYGGMKVIAMTPGVEMITVQCMKCQKEFKRDRSNIRTGKIYSCGGFGCKARAKALTIKGNQNVSS